MCLYSSLPAIAALAQVERPSLFFLAIPVLWISAWQRERRRWQQAFSVLERLEAVPNLSESIKPLLARWQEIACQDFPFAARRIFLITLFLCSCVFAIAAAVIMIL